MTRRKIRLNTNSPVFVYKRRSALLIGLILAFDINGCICGIFITQEKNIKLLLSTPNDVCNSKMNLTDYFVFLLKCHKLLDTIIERYSIIFKCCISIKNQNIKVLSLIKIVN